MRLRKGGLPLETVILAVLFIAVLAIIIIMVSSLVGKGTDSGGQSIVESGGGVLCEIQCMKCCGSQTLNCLGVYGGVDLSQCCEDLDPAAVGCNTPP